MHSLKKIIVGILSFESRLVLKKYKPKIIGVTGSVGKTSTKDAIYTVLSHFVHIRKSEKSFNSEMGVPLSILGLPNAWANPINWTRNILSGFSLILFRSQYPKWLVLEIGADRPNDIKSLVRWIKPSVAVITRFPDVPVHIEYFESRGHVIEEKSSLALAVPADGILVLNADDERVMELVPKVSAQIITYGLGEKADIRAKDISFAYDKKMGLTLSNGLTFTLILDTQEFKIVMPHIVGLSHVYTALAALAIAYKEGFDMSEAIKALAEYRTPPGRLSMLSGINDSFIIDDTYNASPVATEAALEVLRTMNVSGKKIAVLGDMLDLGKYTADAHRNIGKIAVNSCEILITVGVRSKGIYESALESGMAKEKMQHFDTAIIAGEFLKTIIEKGDLVLIKGSQGIRLERAVKMVMANPEDAAKVLVRQEKEWEKR